MEAHRELGRQLELEGAPGALEVRGEPGPPVGSGEDEVGLGLIGGADEQTLLVLLDAVTAQCLDRETRQRQAPPSLGSLRRLEAQALAGLLDRLSGNTTSFCTQR